LRTKATEFFYSIAVSVFFSAKRIVKMGTFPKNWDCAHEFILCKHVIKAYQTGCHALNVDRIKHYLCKMRACSLTLMFLCAMKHFKFFSCLVVLRSLNIIWRPLFYVNPCLLIWPCCSRPT
jgi:hypothetical protein